MLPGAAEWLQITWQRCQVTKVSLLKMYVSNLLELAQALRMKTTDVLWPLQFAPPPGEPEVATSPNLHGYTAQKAVCHSKLHNPGKHNPTTRMTLPV
jgi:hypothetical protein